jgi:hypothetical protein
MRVAKFIDGFGLHTVSPVLNEKSPPISIKRQAGCGRYEKGLPRLPPVAILKRST